MKHQLTRNFRIEDEHLSSKYLEASGRKQRHFTAGNSCEATQNTRDCQNNNN